MLLAGGAVLDGTGGRLDGHGVLVEEGRIVRVAPAGKFVGYAGERVDTSDGTLLPGLIDCHVHLVFGAEADPGTVAERMKPGDVVMRALANAQASLAGGITSIRDCGGRDFLEFSVRDACNAGRQFGPTIRAAGRMICMTGGHGNRWGRVADGVDDVVRAVRENIHAGADLIKMMATGGVMTPGVNPEDAHYTAEEMAAGISEAKRFHRTTASHAQGAEGILNAVRGGVDSIEHGIFLDQRCLEEMLERGTFLVPTCAALVAIKANADKGIPPHILEKTLRVAERHRQAIALFHAAGGRLAMGTDAGTPFNRHGANAMELLYMVDCGVDPATALIAATSNAADLLRLPAKGRIAEGMDADLLLVKGDPLADIRAVADRANHRLVLRGGRRVRRDIY